MSWTPKEIIDDLILWLDADDSSTIEESGGLVSEWLDKSGNSKHAVQATATNRPALIASGQNGKAVITFDGTDNYMTTGALTLGAPTSMFIVFNAHTVTTGDRTLINQQTPSDVKEPLELYFNPSAQLVDWRTMASIPSVSANTCYLLSWIQATNKYVNMWKTGAIGTEGTTGDRYLPSRELSIGRAQSWGSLGYFDGFVAEIVMVTGALVSAERQKMEGYLAWKWGIQDQLPADHPYKTGAPGSRQCYLHARRDRMNMRGVSTQNMFS